MSHLRLVTDPGTHQYQEPSGVHPGTAGAPCRHCGEESAQHVAIRCSGGVSVGPRCELDAVWAVPYGGRRIPFCQECGGLAIDLAMAFGWTLRLDPIGGRA